MSFKEAGLYLARIVANVTYLFVMEPPLWLQVVMFVVPLPILMLTAKAVGSISDRIRH